MTIEQAVVNGINLVYEKEGSGPPLVFLHGFNASAAWWEALIPYFVDDYTCIRLETRGHGRSGRSPAVDYHIDALVDDCVGFLDATVGPAILVGQSVGGAIAMGTAAKRPDMVRAVYCEDSVPSIYGQSGQTDHPILKFFSAVGTAIEERERLNLTVTEYAAHLGQLAPFGRKLLEVWPPQQLIFYARHSYDTDPAWYAVAGGGRQGWPDEVANAIPSQVKCPVHVCYGDSATGSLVKPDDIAALAAAGVNVTSTHFPGAGHGISPAFPREFLNDLKAFLGKVG